MKTKKRFIITCEDKQCGFKCTSKHTTKNLNECALDVSDAIEFLEKYKITTCEAGCGERLLYDNARFNDAIIKRLKCSGRM